MDIHLLAVCGYRVESFVAGMMMRVLLKIDYYYHEKHERHDMVVFLSVLQTAFILLVSLSDSCLLRSARILFGLTQSIGISTVNYFVEGRLGVKFKMMFEGWLMVGERWLNSVRNAAKRGRYASIKYEILGTGDEFAGEDFQNIGAFIVVKSSVFSLSSAQKTHLARDAYHAYSRRAGRRQGLFFQYKMEVESVCAAAPGWYSGDEAELGLPILPNR